MNTRMTNTRTESSGQDPATLVVLERARTNGTAKLQLKIGGMHCSLCTESIHKALGRLDGVHAVQVSIAHEEALVEYDPARVSPVVVEETLEDLGYTVREPDRAEIFAEEERE
ncbi:MAG: heavy-metal-associated domain-containing protein, partial [Candidatus Entotheonellia bacterium]